MTEKTLTEEVRDLSDGVKVLSKVTRRIPRFVRVLAVSVALDILLTLGLVANGIRTEGALEQAKTASSVSRLNCIASNESKANQKLIWDALFASQTPEQLANQTPEERAQNERIKKIIDDATRQEDCK